MWGTSSPEDKLTADLDKVIEATSIRRSWVRFFYSRKIGTGQFGTFATISARKSHADRHDRATGKRFSFIVRFQN
jgi:hypothetical protein